MRQAGPFRAAALAALLGGAAGAQIPLPAGGPPEPVSIHGNQQSAGRRTASGVRIDLEVRSGLWRPQDDAGPAIPVLAFAERGREALNPGPFLRARSGEWIEASVHNRTAVPLVVHGLGEGGAADSFPLPPHGRHGVRFRAPAPGTYYYAANRAGNPLILRFEEDSQLNGVIVVDPPGGPAHPDERFFLISWWFQDPDTTATPAKPAIGTMVINGRPWPMTERFDATVGDTLRWRWVNLTEVAHPMHLHGFYFRVDARGDGRRDTLYSPLQQRLAVTERVGPGETATLSWSPERPGNWLFHCHFAFHISHNVSLVAQRDFSDIGPSTHAGHGMGGLAMGIRVRPRGPALAPASRREVRPLRLFIRSRPNGYGAQPSYGYVMDGTQEAERPDGLSIPGPTLVLERDQPVAITLVNQSREAAAVHWHGIELESFPDGVPNWSGEGANLLRPIPPGDSLVVRFTPPRAGTFMYHSHFNELQQIASGLYAALLVLPPGESPDPERDHVLLFSTGGVPTKGAPILLNGRSPPRPLRLRAGVPHRLRLVNIMANGGVLVTLQRGEVPVRWTPVAKDGADLPAHQRGELPARLRIVAGETYDFVATLEPGDLVLRYRPREGPEISVPVHVFAP